MSGFFDSNGNGLRLSKAAVFRPGRVPVLGRFSLSGGMPYVADGADAVRGLRLQFGLPDGEAWRTAMINLPVFPFRTPEAFYEQLVASRPDPATGKPDPAAMKAFLERLVLPLIGWGMLSAARYPIVLYGPVHLPFILPHNAMLYAVLRQMHTVLAYLFFLTFLAHFGAILFHTLIVRDGILKRMVPWTVRPREPAPTE